MTLASGNGWLRARVIQQAAEKRRRGSLGQAKQAKKRTGLARERPVTLGSEQRVG